MPRPALMLLASAGLCLMAAAGSTPAAEPYPVEVVGDGIPAPIGGLTGDATRGETVARNAANATCLICHALPIADEPDPGNIGPDLSGVGSRYSEAQLRLRLVDPKRINPDTVMPAYYRIEGLNRVLAVHQGQTIYSAQEVEDVVAYLMTLTEPADAPR